MEWISKGYQKNWLKYIVEQLKVEEPRVTKFLRSEVYTSHMSAAVNTKNGKMQMAR